MPPPRKLCRRRKLYQCEMLRIGHAQPRRQHRQTIVRTQYRNPVVETHRFALQFGALVLGVGNCVRQSGQARRKNDVAHQECEHDRENAGDAQYAAVSRFRLFIDPAMRRRPRGARIRDTVVAFELAGLYQLTDLSSSGAQFGAACTNVLLDFVLGRNDRAARQHLKPFVISERMLHDAIL